MSHLDVFVKLSLSLALACFVFPTSAQTLPQTSPTTEHLVWDRVPLAIGLRVGDERLLTLPSAMRVAMPTHMQQKVKVQIVGNTLYLSALKAFPRTRIQAHDDSTGQVILLDLYATQNLNVSAAVDVHLNKPAQPSASNALAAITAHVGGARDDAREDSLGYEDLVRYAAQTFYAPARLAPQRDGIRRVAIEATALPAFIRMAPVHAIPVAAWKTEQHTVTAVRLVNQGSQPVELDMRDVRCRCLVVALQNGRLFPKGDEADNTMAYLVTERSLLDSLE